MGHFERIKPRATLVAARIPCLCVEFFSLFSFVRIHTNLFIKTNQLMNFYNFASLKICTCWKFVPLLQGVTEIVII